MCLMSFYSFICTFYSEHLINKSKTLVTCHQVVTKSQWCTVGAIAVGKWQHTWMHNNTIQHTCAHTECSILSVFGCKFWKRRSWKRVSLLLPQMSLCVLPLSPAVQSAPVTQGPVPPSVTQLAEPECVRQGGPPFPPSVKTYWHFRDAC